MANLPAGLITLVAALKAGPVDMVVDPNGVNQEIFLENGVEVDIQESTEELKVDQLGVVDKYITGNGATFRIVTPALQMSVLAVLFPTGVSGSVGGYNYEGFGHTAGTSERGQGKLIRFRPYNDRASAATGLELFICSPTGPAKQTMRASGGAYKFEREFQAYPDVTRPDGMLIGRIFTQN
jgi:hypothetical protein